MDDETPFDVEAARDLLGIVRAVYRSKRAAGGGAAELERYAEIGRKLSRAIEMASKGTAVAQQCAQSLANDAVVDLGNIIETPELMLLDLVKAAQAAILEPKRRRRA
jgi:hypothetical protein